MKPEEKEALQKVGSEEPREYSVDYINRYIQTAVENGYLVGYNHPYWSMEQEARILSYEGIFSMEMCNYSSYLLNRLEYNAALYDKLLRAGKRIFCHSSDDNHNKFPEGDPESDSFGGFTMILPEEFTYEGVIRAMEQGEMYSSMGPVIKELFLEGDRLHVECSPAASVHLYVGSKTPPRVYAKPGETLTAADFTIDSRAEYFRISVFDREGKAADTRGYLRGIDF